MLLASSKLIYAMNPPPTEMVTAQSNVRLAKAMGAQGSGRPLADAVFGVTVPFSTLLAAAAGTTKSNGNSAAIQPAHEKQQLCSIHGTFSNVFSQADCMGRHRAGTGL
jgi:hypothetical protein